jgi:multidrug efflux pump
MEDRIAGVEGIELITSSSEDGRSNINIEFRLDMDIDAAANDIRDRISGALRNLPDEADPPEVQKADSSEEVILWLSPGRRRLHVPSSPTMRRPLPGGRLLGAARRGAGAHRRRREYAMRVWLDRNALAARNLTVATWRAPCAPRTWSCRPARSSPATGSSSCACRAPSTQPDDFERLALAQGETATWCAWATWPGSRSARWRTARCFRANGVPMVGLGIIKQSTANVLEVSEGVQAELERVRTACPEGMELSPQLRRLGVRLRRHPAGGAHAVHRHGPGGGGDLPVPRQRAHHPDPAVTVPVAMIGAFMAWP